VNHAAVVVDRIGCSSARESSSVCLCAHRVCSSFGSNPNDVKPMSDEDKAFLKHVCQSHTQLMRPARMH
jgi:hypothetical protein